MLYHNVVVLFIGFLGVIAGGRDVIAEPDPVKKPKWQIGVGLGGQALPDYRGSDQRHNKFIPVPIVLYSGRYLKLDKSGARGELYGNKRVQLNLSADAALSADSEDNIARQGMPKLDSAFELGPSVNVRLTGPDFNQGWGLRLPLRAVTTIGGDGIKYRGYVFNPRLVWRKPDVLSGWGLGVSFGSLWGNQKYHSYYYSVLPEYVTSTRNEYAAGSGYSGSYSKLSIRKFTQGWLFGAYIRYDNLAGASFVRSPLVKTKHYGAIGVGIGKVFGVFQ